MCAWCVACVLHGGVGGEVVWPEEWVVCLLRTAVVCWRNAESCRCLASSSRELPRLPCLVFACRCVGMGYMSYCLCL